MSIHYRANFNFANDDIISSKKRLDRYYRLKKRVENSDITTPDDSFVENIKSAMSDDMNISMALSIIDNMVSVANEEIDKTPKDKILISKIHSNLEVIKDIFGILRYSSTEYFQLGVDDNTKQEITKAIESRLEAKKSKNYQLADEIRSRLLEIGISLMDTANGTVWEKI
jgi:cysteinyl-tRNA synthetase